MNKLSVCVTGSRHWAWPAEVALTMIALDESYDRVELVTARSRGASVMAYELARNLRWRWVRQITADYDSHGRDAAFHRNAAIAAHLKARYLAGADVLMVCFDEDFSYSVLEGVTGARSEGRTYDTEELARTYKEAMEGVCYELEKRPPPLVVVTAPGEADSIGAVLEVDRLPSLRERHRNRSVTRPEGD